MNRWCTTLAVVSVVAVASCGGGSAKEAAAARTRDIVVTDAVIGEPAGANAALYLTVTNSGEAPDRLVGAATTVAARAETHETVVEDGRMKMVPVTGGFEIAPGDSLHLAPGGKHIMLFDVSPLAPDDHVDVTLQFETSSDLRIDAVVRPLADIAEMEPGNLEEP